MAKIANAMKRFLSRSLKFIGRNASRFAKVIKFKTSEIREINKRRELISELGEAVYVASQNGLVLPEAAAVIAQQIIALDAELETLRGERAAQKAAYALQRAEEKAARAAEKAAVKAEVAANMTPPAAVMPADGANPVSVEQTTSYSETAGEQSEESSTPDVPTLNL